jgi:hypothetical protein
MSALPQKADVKTGESERPLSAISGR